MGGGGGGGAHGFQGERRGNRLLPTEHMIASLRKTHEIKYFHYQHHLQR